MTPRGRLETRYDVWRCARCGHEVRCRSVPHVARTCCGTGMWWTHFEHGEPYRVEVTP